MVLIRRITDPDRESVDARKNISILLCIYRFLFSHRTCFVDVRFFRKVMVLILLKIVVLLYISIGFHRASVAFGNTDARVFYNLRFNKTLLFKLSLKWHVFLEYKSYTAKYHFRFFFFIYEDGLVY